MKAEVIGFGQACIDFIGLAPFFPKEDGKVKLEEIYIRCGGPVATALVTLSRLGIKTAFIGAVSDDIFGDMIKENLRKEGVDISYMKVIKGYRSQFAFITVTDGKRTIFWKPPSFPEIDPDEYDPSIFQGVKILHLDELMISTSIAIAEKAKKKGILITADIDSMKEGVEKLFSLVDILIIPEGLARQIEGNLSLEEILKKMKLLGPRQVVITMGERGSIGFDGKDFIYQDSFKTHVVDTTGAGDVYHGAYIFGLLKRWDMKRCMKFASYCAALKCRKFGAQEGIPRLCEVKGFIEELEKGC